MDTIRYVCRQRAHRQADLALQPDAQHPHGHAAGEPWARLPVRGQRGFQLLQCQQFAKTKIAVRGGGVAFNGIYALDARDGKYLWHFGTRGEAICPPRPSARAACSSSPAAATPTRWMRRPASSCGRPTWAAWSTCPAPWWPTAGSLSSCPRPDMCSAWRRPAARCVGNPSSGRRQYWHRRCIPGGRGRRRADGCRGRCEKGEQENHHGYPAGGLRRRERPDPVAAQHGPRAQAARLQGRHTHGARRHRLRRHPGEEYLPGP